MADIETLEQLACQRDDAGRRGRPRRDRGLALFDPALGLVLAAATVLIGLAVPLAARRAARAAARVQVAARSDLAAALVNVVQGPSDLLALRRERAFLAALTRLAGGWSGPTAGRRHHVRHAPRLARPRPRSRPRVLLPHRDELRGYDTGKGTIRFQPAHPLPADLVTRLVRERMAETDAAHRR